MAAQAPRNVTACDWRNPDGADAGRATSAPTSATASLTRGGRVAELKDIVVQSNLEVNFGRSQEAVTNPSRC